MVVNTTSISHPNKSSRHILGSTQPGLKPIEHSVVQTSCSETLQSSSSKLPCVHPTSYGMLKKKVGIIITAYIGGQINWGSITGEALRASVSALQAGKKLFPTLAQYLSMLYPPHSASAPRKPLALPALPTHTKQQQALQFAQEEWQDLLPTTSQASPRPTHAIKEQEPIVVANKDFTIRGCDKPNRKDSIVEPLLIPSPHQELQDETRQTAEESKKWPREDTEANQHSVKGRS